jgi:hypothetical protein
MEKKPESKESESPQDTQGKKEQFTPWDPFTNGLPRRADFDTDLNKDPSTGKPF